MTFEQWEEEIKKGLSFQSDESPRGAGRYKSVPSWNYDPFDVETEEEEPTYNPS